MEGEAIDLRGTCSHLWLLLVVAFALMGCAVPAWAEDAGCALTAEQLQQYQADGTLAERQAFYESLGMNQVDPALVKQAQARQSAGPSMLRRRNAATNSDASPGMATTGQAHVLALYVDFADDPDHTFQEGDTLQALQALLNPVQDGQTASSWFPYESRTDYYYRSSYGKLTITGDAVAYHAQHPRSQYTRITLIAEALQALDDQGVDFSKYDANGDGYLDGMYMHFAGDNTGWGSEWWSYAVTASDGDFPSVDGLKVAKYVTLHEPSNTEAGAATLIHETGHVLGLPDYYPYSTGTAAPGTGILTSDMMFDNRGDHDGFSKWLLGWIDDSQITRIIATKDGITVKRGSEVIQTVGPGIRESGVAGLYDLRCRADGRPGGGIKQRWRAVLVVLPAAIRVVRGQPNAAVSSGVQLVRPHAQAHHQRFSHVPRAGGTG